MPTTKPEIHVFPDPEIVAINAAKLFVDIANKAVQSNGFFTVALSGGSTPKKMNRLLVTEAWYKDVPWESIHFFWGDERHVPPNHPDSNYRMVEETLLSLAPVPPQNVHRIKTEYPDANKAAKEYEQEVRSFFKLTGNQLPRFDLAFLGMGPDGHTASLFPGTRAIHEQTYLVVANWVEKFNTDRMTLTPPVLNNAAHVIFLTVGIEKAEALKAVLEGDYEPDRFPSQIIQPTQGTVEWLVDTAAASLLSQPVSQA